MTQGACAHDGHVSRQDRSPAETQGTEGNRFPGKSCGRSEAEALALKAGENAAGSLESRRLLCVPGRTGKKQNKKTCGCQRGPENGGRGREGLS